MNIFHIKILKNIIIILKKEMNILIISIYNLYYKNKLSSLITHSFFIKFFRLSNKESSLIHRIT